eukprot:SAG11_NODE_9631_length_894_cov_0.842767_1_plen_55_part_10
MHGMQHQSTFKLVFRLDWVFDSFHIFIRFTAAAAVWISAATHAADEIAGVAGRTD